MGIAIPQVVTEDRASGALSVGGSLRFNGSNQYLRKTFGTEGNRQVFTWSCWIKRNGIDTWQRIFTCEPSSNNVAGLSFRDPDSKIRLQQQDNAGAQGNNHLLTVPYYRDISGFYHVVMAVDTVNATAADRFKIYINGERQSTTWDTGGNPGQLSKLFYNSGDDFHEIGHSTHYNAYHKGQMAQCYWIDGLQLEPSEFGFTDPLTNTWRPKNIRVLSVVHCLLFQPAQVMLHHLEVMEMLLQQQHYFLVCLDQHHLLVILDKMVAV